MRRVKNDPNLYFDYRDVKTLQRYIDAYGRIEPISKTGLSAKKQRQHGPFPPRGQTHPVRRKAEAVQPQVRGMREDGYGVSRAGVPLLLPVCWLPLLLPGAYQQSRPLYRVTVSGPETGPEIFWKT